MRVPSTTRVLHKVRRRLQYTKKRPGEAPGTLVYEGQDLEGPVGIHVFDYAEGHITEHSVDDVEACARFRGGDGVTWINVDGVHDVGVVEEIGALYGLHPLTLEDIVSTDQRPKLEEYPDYVYIVLTMMHYDHDTGAVDPEQVSLVIGRGFLLSFQEAKEGDVFDPVRQRLRSGRGVIRSHGADYLAYALIDVVVDYYMEILEGLGEHIEDLEDEVTARPDTDLLREINRVRRRVVTLRRSIWPLRDVLVGLERSDRPFITDEIDPYLRDVYDHTVRTVELIESARDILASLVDLHLSTASNRMNEVMKTLAIISTVFLPLTFIAGVYGMNFNPNASPLNMPELNWFFGYPFSLGLMLAVGVAMYVFFRRRDWL